MGDSTAARARGPGEPRPRVGFLGPDGTFTEEALRASSAREVQEVPYPTVREAVVSVQNGAVDRAVVPIENALEGSVRATLDTLVAEAPDVRIEAQFTHPIRHCLVAGARMDLGAVTRVVSHPQALSQCRDFVRERLPQARPMAASSTAEAVRVVVGAGEPWAALGTRLAAEIYDGEVIAEGVADRDDNVTRFVWLARSDDRAEMVARTDRRTPSAKTSIVFWGFDDESPGALARVLSELADRGVNLTKIESRPRRVRLGHYMFFADLDGSMQEAPMRAALEALGRRVETLRVLGSYPSD